MRERERFVGVGFLDILFLRGLLDRNDGGPWLQISCPPINTLLLTGIAKLERPPFPAGNMPESRDSIFVFTLQ